MTTTQKPIPLLLEGPKDWEEWYEVVRSSAQSRGFFELVDISAATQPPQPTRPAEPSYQDINPVAISFAGLTNPEKEHYKVLLTEYRNRLVSFNEERTAFIEINDLIQRSIARGLKTYIRGLNTPYEMLKALKKRLAPTDRAKRLELARAYQALKKAPKAQSLDSWLLLWETTYARAEELNLAEIQDHKALYDFLQATKSVDAAWASAYMVQVDMALETDTNIPTLYDVVERFRNVLRLDRATSKAPSHTAFATLQGEAAADSETQAAQAAQAAKSSKKRSNCVCGEDHSFAQCPYLIKQRRDQGWSPNAQIQKQIDEKLAKNPNLKRIIEEKQKKAEEQVNKQAEPQKAAAAATLTSFAVDLDSYELRNTWILDSGANSHVCNDPKRFKFERAASEEDVLKAGKTTYAIEAFGSVTITIRSPNGPRQIHLLDVALVPGFLTNTASLHRFTAKGVHWDTQKQRLHVNGETFCHIERVGSHWALEHNPQPQTAESSAIFASKKSRDPRKAIEATAERWHALLGHPGDEAIENLQQNALGAVVTAPATGVPTPCEPCALGTAHKIISRRSTQSEPAEKPLERVAYDLIPMDIGYNGDKWVSHFYCFVTGMDFVYTHRKKSHAFDVIEEFLKMVKTRYNRTVRFIRTDGERTLGGRYDELTRGITTERSSPDTPEQNGAAERSGGVIIRKARCLRIAANLPANLWPEIVKATGYLNNRTPKRSRGWKTPYEALLEQKPNLAHLHAYGCKAYPLNKDIPRKQKMLPRAHIGYLVGYESTNIYRIWIPSLEKVVRTRDVTFDEQQFYDPADLDIAQILRETADQVVEILEMPDLAYTQSNSLIGADEEEEDEIAVSSPPAQPAQADSAKTTPPNPLPTPQATPQATPAPPTQLAQATQPASTANSAPAPTAPPPENQSDFSTQNILPEGSKRSRTSTRRQNYAVALTQASELSAFYTAFALGHAKAEGKKWALHRDTLPPEPRTWRQMIKHKFAAEFKEAADREIQELTKRETFKWVDKEAATAIPLPLLWVFKYKFDTDGYLTKFKARLCVRGDLQSTEQDTYAATLAARTFRALMAISAAFDLEMRQYDAVNAFVNSRLDELIWCLPPEGYERLEQLWLLLRALYGLKRSPLLWYTDFTAALEELGLHSIPGVNCLFASDCLLLFFYVDDIAVLYDRKHEQKFKEFERRLLQRFEMRSLGELNWFLGIRIVRERATRKLWLCQDSYISKIAAKFNVDVNSKHPKTPLPLDDALTAELGDEKATAQQILAYQQRIGSLNFAAVISRPDIAHAVSKLAQFLKNPGAAHIAAANRVIKYLCGTRTLAIEYSGRNNSQIFNCASDAAFADDSATRHSSDGYLFQLYGGPIDWRAGKQKTVTTSSTEAELLALSTASREVIWWRRFFDSIRFDTQQSIKIHCDNMQTIRLLTKEGVKLDSKLRHVDIHRHWLRQEIQQGRIALEWKPTAEMPADGLTKPLPTQKHAAFVQQLNLVDISTRLMTEQQQAPQHTTEQEQEQEDIDTLSYAYLGEN